MMRKNQNNIFKLKTNNEINLKVNNIETNEIETNSHKDKEIVYLEIINLTKQYTKKAKPAIENISFKVKEGEFHAFIGANGAGKTTTIKSIVGAYADFNGVIKICGIDNKKKESRAKLGYIPETAKFPSNMSSFLYLKSMAELNGLSSKEAATFSENILKEFNMWNLRNVCPNKFSSGQKKKILLAQSLSNDPDILIMDEPTANLDPKSRIAFFEILKNLQSKGKAIFISSHILSELDIYANAMTILDGGKIVFTGKRENINQGKWKNYKLITSSKLSTKLIEKFSNIEIRDYHESEKNTYILKLKKEQDLVGLVTELINKNILVKIERYHLTIEEMYKKYVILGSVHTKKEQI